MNETIFTILNNHEFEDEKVAMSKDKMIATIKEEFANADEVLAKAFELVQNNVNPLKMENGIIYFPIIPIRKDKGLHIRKHTICQVPYVHSHTFYELIYVSSGKCEQLINGTKTTMVQQDLCILSPKTKHAIMQSSKKDIILKIVIPKDVFNSINNNILQNEQYLLLHNVGIEAEYLLFKVLKESFICDKFYNDTIKNYLSLLFIELARSRNIDNNIFLEKITHFIDSNIATVTLDKLASDLGYNKTYLSRIIKQKTNQTFSELLVHMRMQKASQMILDNICIDDISCEIGYQTTSGFYKQFNKYYGMSPIEYKKLL